MCQWVVRIFAAIGFLAVLLVALIAAGAIYNTESAPEEPESVILALNFDQPIVEEENTSPFSFALDESETPLLDIVRALDHAGKDPHVKGVVARFGSTQPTLAQAQEIRAALERFRDTGKFTYAFGPSYGDFGLGSRVYYLASAFENIWLQPVGAVSLTGVSIQAPFAKDALAKIGVAPEFMRREEYKSFMEVATETTFTPPVRANMQAMIDDVADQIAGGIAKSRKWDKPHVERLMETGPYTADEALKAGLVTRIGYADELDEELKKKAGADAKQVAVEDYLDFVTGTGGSNANPNAHVALIYGTGLITDHAVDGDFSGEDVMGADKIAKAFDDAAKDNKIRAILFRIDSPGGSPQASETIRRAMIHAEKVGKPVFVSMGAVAASGGYWIAMSANHIVAEPGTLTGSIGVVGGKFVVAGLMKKLGISWDTLATSSNAAMWSMVNGFTPQQRARFNAFLDEDYHAFVANVAAARKIPMERMPFVAKGRVFTGAQGVKNGLVDELGGYDTVLAAIRHELHLSKNDVVTLELFPPPETATEKIINLIKKTGLESLAFGQATAGWHNIQMRFGPFLSDAIGAQPVTAKAPAPLLELVR